MMADEVETTQGRKETRMLSKKELFDRRESIGQKMQAVANELQQTVKDADTPHPMLDVFQFEAQRRMEEVMHRVSDIVAVLMHRSDENAEQLVKAAFESANADKAKGK
jgi:hypothetical protein